MDNGPMDNGTKAQELWGQMAGKAIETIGVWAETNQRMLRELVELSGGAAKEGARLYADLQRSAIDTLRDAQADAIRWQGSCHQVSKDPATWYQTALTESVNRAQKVFHLIEENAQAVTRAAERLQGTAEQTGKAMQETFAEAVAKVKGIYSQN